MAAHAGLHITVAIFSLLLLSVPLRILPPAPPGWIGRGSRTVLLGGLIVLVCGQIVEAIGAFGFRGNAPVSSLATLHDIAVWVSSAGMSVTMLGTALTIVVLAAVRFDKLDSPWVPVAFAVATVGAAAFVAGAIVFGY